MVMAYPALVHYGSVNEYRNHFTKIYCAGSITTFDGIAVRFRRRDFDHAFYESVHAKDDTFSDKRAERIDWIKCALQDPDSECYIGWDNKKKRYLPERRVAIVVGNYVVIISIYADGRKADFVTAYLADSRDKNGRLATIAKIKASPKWKLQK